MYERLKDFAKELEINIAKVGAIKKSTWKRLVKYKMKNKIEERLKREMEGKTKSRTIKEGKWKMKEYILNCHGEDARDIILIRLHMLEVQMNYKKETESVMWSLCERKEDTTEHIIECGWENEKMFDLKDEHTKKEWLDVTKIYKENKRKREMESERLEENEKRKEIEVVVEKQKENEKRQLWQNRSNKRRSNSRSIVV